MKQEKHPTSYPGIYRIALPDGRCMVRRAINVTDAWRDMRRCLRTTPPTSPPRTLPWELLDAVNREGLAGVSFELLETIYRVHGENNVELDRRLKDAETRHSDQQRSRGLLLSYDRPSSRVNRHSGRNYRIITDGGDIVMVQNLRRYCEEHALSYGMMRRVLSGRLREHRGFMVDEV